jgi:dTDP-4-amino-4,6-dideoxygalactose transaminase
MLRRLVGHKTLCIVATHLFGAALDLNISVEPAQKWGAFVVEDAAQGGEVDSDIPRIDARIYSTSRGKPWSTFRGGLVACKLDRINSILKQRYRMVPGATIAQGLTGMLEALASEVLCHPRLYWLPASMPFLHLGRTSYPDAINVTTMPRFHVAMLESVTRDIIAVKKLRQQAAQFYARNLSAVTAKRQPSCVFNPDYSPARYPFYLERPIAELRPSSIRRARQLGVVPMYPSCLVKLNRVRRHWVNHDDCFPGAAAIADRLVTLPTHHWVRDGLFEKIVGVVSELQ